MARSGTALVREGLARMLKGGTIMDVTTAEQAKIAEDAGAVAVMALERVPADIRVQGGVARMADLLRIKEIMAAVTIPVMAKVRIGHFVEAQILEALWGLIGALFVRAGGRLLWALAIALPIHAIGEGFVVWIATGTFQNGLLVTGTTVLHHVMDSAMTLAIVAAIRPLLTVVRLA